MNFNLTQITKTWIINALICRHFYFWVHFGDSWYCVLVRFLQHMLNTSNLYHSFYYKWITFLPFLQILQFLDWELHSVTTFSMKIERTFSLFFILWLRLPSKEDEEGTSRVRFKAALAVVELTPGQTQGTILALLSRLGLPLPKPSSECSQNQSLNLVV